MGMKGILDALYLSSVKYVTRTGVAADCAAQHTVNIFTIAGGDIVLLGIYGKVRAQKQANAQTLQLQITPTGGAAAALCAASATTSGDAVDSIYTITGVSTDAMIVAQIGTALGIGQLQASALGIGTGNPLVLVPGILSLITAAANDNSGLVDWTVIYRPVTNVSIVTVL